VQREARSRFEADTVRLGKGSRSHKCRGFRPGGRAASVGRTNMNEYVGRERPPTNRACGVVRAFSVPRGSQAAARIDRSLKGAGEQVRSRPAREHRADDVRHRPLDASCERDLRESTTDRVRRGWHQKVNRSDRNGGRSGASEQKVWTPSTLAPLATWSPQAQVSKINRRRRRWRRGSGASPAWDETPEAAWSRGNPCRAIARDPTEGFEPEGGDRPKSWREARASV
jgi:hypothetical protein